MPYPSSPLGSAEKDRAHGSLRRLCPALRTTGLATVWAGLSCYRFWKSSGDTRFRSEVGREWA
jgi:hypothetical protein